jgi:hypothetical protein
MSKILNVVRFEVSTAVTMKNAVFCDVSRVALVRTDVSEERIASITRETRIGEIGTTFAVTSNEARCAATRRHSSQDGSVHFCSYSSCNILRSHMTRLPNSKYFHHFKKHSSMVRCTGNRKPVHFLKTGRNRLVCGRGVGGITILACPQSNSGKSGDAIY